MFSTHPCGHHIEIATRWNGLADVPVYFDNQVDSPTCGHQLTECPTCGETICRSDFEPRPIQGKTVADPK